MPGNTPGTRARRVALAVGACSGEGDEGGGGAPEVLPALPTLAMAEVPPGEMSVNVLDVTAHEAKELIQSDASVIVLDVRTPDEFAEGHIKGAVNLDFMSETFFEDLDKLDKSASYVVYCRSGRRSAKAIDAMKAAQIESIAHMNTGMNGWSAAGLPVTQ